jgi:ATP-dependent Clp protease protease subunit
MPFGIPKVPFYFYSRDPDSSKPILNIEYLSLRERFLDERILFVFRNIDKPFMHRILNIVLVLQSIDDTDIAFYINSKGGDARATLGLYDIMESLSCDVCTKVVGLAASGASLILAAGTNSKRVALPHARIMMHQPRLKRRRRRVRKLRRRRLGTRRVKKCVRDANEMRKLRNTFADIYAQKTGQPINVVQNDLERDTFMSAEEAQEYGIIDHIVRNSTK